jgi:hypothetical protein
LVTVDAARSDPPTPRARACKKEKRIRWRERREQRSEEFRLREHQGLSPPATSEYSSSDEEEEEEEEEESDGGRALPERWEPTPPHQESRRQRRRQRLGRAQ